MGYSERSNYEGRDHRPAHADRHRSPRDGWCNDRHGREDRRGDRDRRRQGATDRSSDWSRERDRDRDRDHRSKNRDHHGHAHGHRDSGRREVERCRNGSHDDEQQHGRDGEGAKRTAEPPSSGIQAKCVPETETCIAVAAQMATNTATLPHEPCRMAAWRAKKAAMDMQKTTGTVRAAPKQSIFAAEDAPTGLAPAYVPPEEDFAKKMAHRQVEAVEREIMHTKRVAEEEDALDAFMDAEVKPTVQATEEAVRLLGLRVPHAFVVSHSS